MNTRVPPCARSAPPIPGGWFSATGRPQAILAAFLAAVDAALEHLHRVAYPNEVTSTVELPPVVSPKAPEFVQKVKIGRAHV